MNILLLIVKKKNDSYIQYIRYNQLTKKDKKCLKVKILKFLIGKILKTKFTQGYLQELLY